MKMTDSEALAVLDRMLGQALAFRESSSKTDSTKSEQYSEDCKAFAHIAEALRDAERYRWLRNSADIAWNDWVTHSMLIATDEERAELDSAIDAAMKEAT